MRIPDDNLDPILAIRELSRRIFSGAQSLARDFAGPVDEARDESGKWTSGIQSPFPMASIEEAIKQKKKDAHHRLPLPGEDPAISETYAWRDNWGRQFAKNAQRQGLYKIDMPVDLLTSTNKVYPNRMQRMNEMGGSTDPGFVSIDTNMSTGEPIYSVEDGNHRVAYAKATGKKTVPMYVMPEGNTPEARQKQLEKLKQQIDSRSNTSRPGMSAPVDTTRQLGLFARDSKGNPQEIGERPGQGNLFNIGKPMPEQPKAEPVKRQFDPRHTTGMFGPMESMPEKRKPAASPPEGGMLFSSDTFTDFAEFGQLLQEFNQAFSGAV